MILSYRVTTLKYEAKVIIALALTFGIRNENAKPTMGRPRTRWKYQVMETVDDCAHIMRE
jgi:hypothetical protein